MLKSVDDDGGEAREAVPCIKISVCPLSLQYDRRGEIPVELG